MSISEDLKEFQLFYQEVKIIISLLIILRYIVIIKCAIYLLNMINVIINLKLIENEKRDSLLSIIDHCIDEKLHKEILRKSKNPNEKSDYDIYIVKNEKLHFSYNIYKGKQKNFGKSNDFNYSNDNYEDFYFNENDSSSNNYSNYKYKSKSMDDSNSNTY